LKKILFVISFFASVQAFSQNLMLYSLRETPNSLALNPANALQCKFFIGVPVLSAIQYHFASSSFSYNDFITQGTGSKSDSLIFNYAAVSEKVKRNNFVNNSISLVWIDGGFNLKKSYISFSVKSVANFNLYYSKDLIDLFAGNWNSAEDEPLSFQLSNNKPDLLAYTAFSGNFSKEFNSKLRLGVKISYLKGAMLFKAPKSDFEIATTDNPLAISFSPDYKIQASFPMTYFTDSSEKISQIRPVFSSPIQHFLWNKNRGASLGFGVIYQINKQLRFSASVVDLGFIFWKSNAMTLQAKENFTFTGFDLNQYTTGTAIATDIRTLLKDSVKNLMHYTHEEDAFFVPLPVRSFFSAEYQLSEKLNFSTISAFFYASHAIFWQQNVSIQYKLHEMLKISSGINYMNHQIKNFGLSLVFTKNPVQFYVSTDNVVFRFVKDIKTNYLLPFEARSLSFSFGLNLVFGCSTKNLSRDNSICPAYK
jgi:hypothetical protein